MSTRIILVGTQLPENLGAVARVMGNFNQTHLRLVMPLADKNDSKAIAMAVSAHPILTNSICFDSIQDATHDCCTVIGTTAQPRDVIKHHATPFSFAAACSTLPSPVGILFGPERTGLTTDQIALCQQTLHIPVNPECSSLNLSHAVGIILYELFQKQNATIPFWQHGKTPPATAADVDAFLTFLEEKLDHTHFWRTESKKPGMRRNLFGFFKRQIVFRQDIQTLRGMIEALESQALKR